MEAWQRPELRNEMDRAHAITEGGLHTIRNAPPAKPFLLWLHYVNPHAPYNPPPPHDKRFLDPAARRERALPVTKGYHGGVQEKLAAEMGPGNLAYYVARYDGEI